MRNRALIVASLVALAVIAFGLGWAMDLASGQGEGWRVIASEWPWFVAAGLIVASAACGLAWLALWAARHAPPAQGRHR